MSVYTTTKTITKAMSYVAATALVGLMLITAFDVVTRNLGIYHLKGILDISRLLLLVAGGFSLAHAFLDNGHLIAELGTHGFSSSTKHRMEAVWYLLAVVPFCGIAYFTYLEGVHLSARGDIIGILGWSPMLFHTLTAIAFSGAALASLVIGVRKVAGRDESINH